jgi:hypothetical protein
MDIITFANDVLRKHLFDYEIHTLLHYEEKMEWSSFNEWIRPSKRENQYIMNIWLSYQEYCNGSFDNSQLMIV